VNPKEIDVQTAAKWLNDGQAILVDVREAEENRQARIPGSILHPLSRFDPADMPSAEGKKILVYCAMGGRSQNAVIQCWHAGIEAINVAGGIVAWHRAGLPLEAG